MPRPTWKGYLKLSLVSCPVALYPATSTRERISFNIMNRKTGHRTRYLVVDSETEEPVEPEDRIRGYAVGKNDYVYVEDSELDSVKLESTHTIDIDNFVPRKEVDEVYLDAPYYLAPEGKIGQDAFLVIREAIRKKQMAAVARVVMARRERMLLLEPRGNGLLATTLRNANEVRSEAAYFEDIPEIDIPDEMLSIAMDIVDRKVAHFDPSKFEDRYESALREIIESKKTGEPVHVPEAPRPHPTANLMEALRRSLEGEPASRSRPRSRGVTAPSATARRRGSGKTKTAARRAS